MGNDDEFELTMQPFIWKVGNFSDDVYPSEEELRTWRGMKARGEVGVLEEEVGVDRWTFLKDWKTSVKEETLEKLSKRGSDDSEVSLPSSSTDSLLVHGVSPCPSSESHIRSSLVPRQVPP